MNPEAVLAKHSLYVCTHCPNENRFGWLSISDSNSNRKEFSNRAKRRSVASDSLFLLTSQHCVIRFVRMPMSVR